MRTEHLLSTLAAGILIVAGCGSPETDEGGAAGKGAGGNSASGTGGSSTVGVAGAGGPAGAIGTAGAPGHGGSSGVAGQGGPGGQGGSGTGVAGGSSGGSTGAAGAAAGSTGSGGASGGSVGNAGRGGTGGSATGGRGGGAAGATGGSGAAGATGGSGAAGKGGSTGGGTCTASKAAGSNASGSGPHKVTVETNSDSGIKEGTIFRPTDLGGTEKYPIFAWGEGACSLNGLSTAAAMGEIASHGYFVIADGTPNGSGGRSMGSDPVAMGKPLLAYIAWAIAENDKPCSAYYQSLDTTKIATNGFSCGGLMSEGTAPDPRITTWGINSSGLLSANANFLKMSHTPVLIVLGGSGDVAYPNGERDYTTLAGLGVPVLLFSKALGHGGDLFSTRGGDFTKIDLAWLNWHLKGDLTATGKGLLVGSGCPYCKDSAWEVKSMNIQ